MSAPELIAQVNGIITRAETAQFFLEKARQELVELAGDLLALDIGGSNSTHVATANRLLPLVVTELSQVPFDLSLIKAEMQQYRRKLE